MTTTQTFELVLERKLNTLMSRMENCETNTDDGKIEFLKITAALEAVQEIITEVTQEVTEGMIIWYKNNGECK